MIRRSIILLFSILLTGLNVYSQNPDSQDESNQTEKDSSTFKTLDKGYSESGFEINNILFGLGLGFAYRYGSYHLPEFEDNFAFKFTFNVKLE